MSPDLPLEHYLCAHIKTQNFDSTRAQVVPANSIDDSVLMLPRIVVECASGSDPVMAQAGVFPVQVSVTLIFNAREPDDLYLLDPLRDAVVNALQFPRANEQSFGISIYGSTLGDISTSQADDRLEVIVSATFHARRI
jgi:hypothetical protein